MNAPVHSLSLELSASTLPSLFREVVLALPPIKDAALAAVRARVSVNGKVDRKLIDAEQHVVHGLAWYATYVET